MTDSEDRLYQFWINPIGGARYTATSPTHMHTLQLFLSRDDALDLLMVITRQLKERDDVLRVELGGKMIVADIDKG